jgi:uncharacterized membrane protein
MDDLVIARILHVLGVVHWVGGLAFVTLVILPLACRRGAEGVALFEIVERRFSGQVRLSVLLVGASGFWMTWRMEAWGRFHDPAFWWMGAMLALWLLFMLLLFVVEPLVGGRAAAAARRHPDVALKRLARMHGVLLLVAAVTLLGAVGGAHGLF